MITCGPEQRVNEGDAGDCRDPVASGTSSHCGNEYVIKRTKANSPRSAAGESTDERLVVEVVVSLMANGFFTRMVRRASPSRSKAPLVPAAIPAVAPIVDKNHEAGEPSSSVFGRELVAVRVPDARLREVSRKPVGIVEGVFKYLKV
jgi:hypothetical protein